MRISEGATIFSQKLTFMKFLRETLNYQELDLSVAEKTIIKDKFVDVLESIDFSPKKYKRKVITEKHKKAPVIPRRHAVVNGEDEVYEAG
jgi:hypothetical protein